MINQMVVIVPTFMHTMDEVMRMKGFRILSKMTPKGIFYCRLSIHSSDWKQDNKFSSLVWWHRCQSFNCGFQLVMRSWKIFQKPSKRYKYTRTNITLCSLSPCILITWEYIFLLGKRIYNIKLQFHIDWNLIFNEKQK